MVSLQGERGSEVTDSMMQESGPSEKFINNYYHLIIMAKEYRLSEIVQDSIDLDMPKAHFGHPMNTYGTDIERKLIDIIENHFPDYNLDNCNQPYHQEAAKKLREETGRPMEYFFKKFIPYMSLGIFLPYKDGMFGAGVYDEAVQMDQEGKPIFQIDYKGIITEMQLDDSKRLSISETQSRNKVSE